MDGPGPLIAIDVILIYIIMGPLVLFATYVIFDSLLEIHTEKSSKVKEKKDPALWTDEDVDNLIN